MLFVLCLCFPLWVDAQSVMTDNQIVEYVKSGVAAGKSQSAIAGELVLKGVSRQQLLKVYKKYQQDSAAEAEAQGDDLLSAAKVSRFQSTGEDMDSLFYEWQEEQIPDSMQVYGRNIFRKKNLSFAPNENMATPRNYVLGPGDEVVLVVYGANQNLITKNISPEGTINIDALGPVQLSGMTVEEANSYLRKRLSRIYSGLGQDAQSTDISLTIGQIRNIQINVLGDVEAPGTYQMPAFSTAFHALYLAGGVKEPGSLRNIKVNRGGRQIATIDVYDFLQNGNRKGDVQLQDGDVIVVPAYDTMVTLRGKVKRPMLFEMKRGENLMQLLNYAGGFAKEAYRNSITIVRQNGRDYEIHTVDDARFTQFAMMDGDSVVVGRLLSRFQNRLTVKGAVFRAGDYQLGGQVNTVKTLIEKAGGLLPEAFTNRAVLHRENEDRSLKVESVDLAGILAGRVPDMVLKNNDVLYIPSIYDLKDQGTLTIAGEVAAPGTFPYAENTTLEDLIIQAGGLLQSASLARVDVSRRLTDNNATTAQKELAQLYSFSIKDGFVIEGEPGFVLHPYDEVYVRKSPSYSVQRNVSVTGEANFTGSFPLTLREERLSSLLQKCGGTTEYAYIEGARLVRQINDEERKMMDKVVESMMNDVTDSLTAVRMRNYGNEYYVGIDLKKALANPGGDDDVILREGDRLEIPVYNNTVRVLGAVTSSNVVTYSEGKRFKYYINEAGGYSDMARKRHAYIVYMNGHISQLKHNTKVLPGSEIVVPKRSRGRLRFTEAVSSISGLATLATTLVSLAYVFKK